MHPPRRNNPGFPIGGTPGVIAKLFALAWRDSRHRCSRSAYGPDRSASTTDGSAGVTPECLYPHSHAESCLDYLIGFVNWRSVRVTAATTSSTSSSVSLGDRGSEIVRSEIHLAFGKSSGV